VSPAPPPETPPPRWLLDMLADPPELAALAEPAGKSHRLSASQVISFADCPERWRRRYLLRDPEPFTAALVWGTADSEAAAHNYRQKIESGEQLATDEVLDVFRDEARAGVEAAGGPSEVLWDRIATDADALVDAGTRLAAVYHEQIAPAVQPIAVERRFTVAIGDAEVIGYVDAETETAIIERKTASRQLRVPTGAYQAQAIIYQAAIPKPVQWHVGVKRRRNPTVYTATQELGEYNPEFEAAYSVGARLEAERLVNTTLDAVTVFEREFSDRPWPGARYRPLSPCSRCGYRPTCAWWRS
jgi:hypothetical protein